MAHGALRAYHKRKQFRESVLFSALHIYLASNYIERSHTSALRGRIANVRRSVCESIKNIAANRNPKLSTKLERFLWSLCRSRYTCKFGLFLAAPIYQRDFAQWNILNATPSHCHAIIPIPTNPKHLWYQREASKNVNTLFATKATRTQRKKEPNRIYFDSFCVPSRWQFRTRNSRRMSMCQWNK